MFFGHPDLELQIIATQLAAGILSRDNFAMGDELLVDTSFDLAEKMLDEFKVRSEARQKKRDEEYKRERELDDLRSSVRNWKSSFENTQRAFDDMKQRHDRLAAELATLKSGKVSKKRRTDA